MRLTLALPLLASALIAGCAAGPDALPDDTRYAVYRTVAEELDAALAEAARRETAGDAAGALVQYRRALAIDPHQATAAEAAARLERQVRRRGDYYYRRGTALRERDPLAALRAFNRALRIAPGNLDARTAHTALLTHPLVAAEMQGLERALAQALEAAQTSPGAFAELEEGIDALLRYDGDHPPALEAREALRVSRAQRVARYTAAGVAHYRAGEMDAAKEAFRNVQAVDPGNREATDWIRRIQHQKDLDYFVNLARYRAGKEEWEKALEYAGQALAIDPDHPQANALRDASRARLVGAWSEQARAAAEAGEWAELTRLAGRILELDPTQSQATDWQEQARAGDLERLLAAARSRFEAGDWEAAVASATRAAELAPNEPRAAELLRLARSGEVGAHLARVRGLLAQDRFEPAADRLLALFNGEAAVYDEVYTRLQEAADELVPKLRAHAQALFEQRRFEQARALFERLLRFDPEDRAGQLYLRKIGHRLKTIESLE